MLTYIGNISIVMTRKQAESCSHPGPCDDDVKALSERQEMRRQLLRIDPEKLRTELREYGAWDDAELADHEQNLLRALWIAACQITDR